MEEQLSPLCTLDEQVPSRPVQLEGEDAALVLVENDALDESHVDCLNVYHLV